MAGAGAAGAVTGVVRSSSGLVRPRAPWTRSGRTAMTAPTVSAVIAASPIPIRTWTPTMAVKTLPIGTSAVPPRAYRAVKAIAAAGTEIRAATKAATVTEERRRGRTFTRPRKSR